MTATASPAPAPASPLTTDELEGRLDAALTIRVQAERRLQRARLAAVNGDAEALAEEGAAETSLAEVDRQIARLQGALAEQQHVDEGDAHAERLRSLEVQEEIFLKHLGDAEAAGKLLETHLAGYVKAYDGYVVAASLAQQMAPALGSRIRHDFGLDRGETLVGDELARITANGRHVPGTSLHALQAQGDPTRLPPLLDRIKSLTGEWRSNVEAARRARGAPAGEDW